MRVVMSLATLMLFMDYHVLLLLDICPSTQYLQHTKNGIQNLIQEIKEHLNKYCKNN